MAILSNITTYSSDDNNIDIIKFNDYIQLESSEQIYLNYSIFQNNNFFKFGIDSFLLSKFFLENTTIKHIILLIFVLEQELLGYFHI